MPIQNASRVNTQKHVVSLLRQTIKDLDLGINAISPRVIPQEVANPAVAFYLTGNEPTRTQDSRHSVLDAVEVQLNIFADSWEQMSTIGHEIKFALEQICYENDDFIGSVECIRELDAYNEQTRDHQLTQFYTFRVNTNVDLPIFIPEPELEPEPELPPVVDLTTIDDSFFEFQKHDIMILVPGYGVIMDPLEEDSTMFRAGLINPANMQEVVAQLKHEGQYHYLRIDLTQTFGNTYQDVFNQDYQGIVREADLTANEQASFDVANQAYPYIGMVKIDTRVGTELGLGFYVPASAANVEITIQATDSNFNQTFNQTVQSADLAADGTYQFTIPFAFGSTLTLSTGAALVYIQSTSLPIFSTAILTTYITS